MPIRKKIQLSGFDLDVEVSAHTGIQEVDLQEFSQAFLFVWSRIMPQHQYEIAKHWRGKQFQLVVSEQLFGAIATTETGYLEFEWKTCKLFRKGGLNAFHALIAHEMGHAYQAAVGLSRANIREEHLRQTYTKLPFPLRTDSEMNGLLEFHADEMAERWRFDPILIDVFLRRHFEVGGDGAYVRDDSGEYVALKKPLSEKNAHKKAKADRFNSRFDWKNIH